MSKIIKVTIENNEDSEKYEVYFDDFDAIQELGLFINDQGEIVPNGQYRLTLKAWRGCKTFDSFETL